MEYANVEEIVQRELDIKTEMAESEEAKCNIAIENNEIKCEAVIKSETGINNLENNDYYIDKKDFELKAIKSEEITIKHESENFGNQDVIFSCGECHYQTNKKKNLGDHQRRHKKKTAASQPEDTSSPSPSLGSQKRIHSGEKNFSCKMCSMAFHRLANLKMHIATHTGEKPHKCSVCGMQFVQLIHLRNHERIHSGERPYVCKDCDKSFARHSTLWNHRRIHTGEKPYVCDICGSSFSQATHLKNHRNVHSFEKPFKCDICSQAFKVRSGLKRHMDIHVKYGQTKAQVPSSDNDEGNNPSDGNYNQNDGAPTHIDTTATTTNLDEFLEMEYSDEKTEVDITLEPMNSKAKDLLGSLTSEHSLIQQEDSCEDNINQDETHNLRHKESSDFKTYTCDEDISDNVILSCGKCDYVTNNKKNFSSHEWRHKQNPEEKNFQCEICGLAFHRLDNLKMHFAIHTGEKPHRCGACGMQFAQSAHLNNHKRIHSGERPYACQDCDKSFARHSTLWHHRRVHTGEKPYTCDICGSSFSQATHLKTHQKVHSFEKPSKCGICCLAFKDRGALRRHMDIHVKYGQTKAQVLSSDNDEGNNPSDGNSQTEESTIRGVEDEIIDPEYEQGQDKMHTLPHEEPPDIKMYPCDKCSFRSTYEEALQYHMLRHKEPSEDETFSCGECNYQTKNKKYFRSHQWRHKNRRQGSRRLCCS